VLLSTHVLPDGDGLGAQAALFYFFKQRNITTFIVNNDPLPPRYSFLDKGNFFSQALPHPPELSVDEKPVILLIVDTFLPSRIGGIWNSYRKYANYVFFLDHHLIPESPRYSPNEYLISEPSRSSIGELTYELLKTLQRDETFGFEIWQSLYVSVMTDTNSFRYARTTSLAHEIAAKSVLAGVNPELVYQEIYSSKTLNHVKFLGQLLSETKTAFDEKVAWIEIKSQGRDDFEATEDDTLSFPNSLLLLQKAEVVCSFREADNQTVRVSLRSKGRVAVIDVALALGGGGHEFSAGARVAGTLDTVREKTLRALKPLLQT